MAATQLYKDLIFNYAKSLGKSAKLTIDGIEKDYELLRSVIEEGKVRHTVYLTSEKGKVSEAKLYDALGRELQSAQMNVVKGEDGLAVVFTLEIPMIERVK